ncbi:MAG TPA: tRNA (adenosine(37)-N6)-dimethylallyltransferase MiaA [Albidovulum sp.]|uniref:tRNA (adenosine(37)-N6)-dimethylallyltransferase MiaA n=1 Tax=Albidovulum sp. TaxID=1872424 RepID=UPI002B6294B2|nr:tRNA (adenosine(37)-N6)-dimethylallyltransferase MiaA [Albidovulum sp.]
MTLLDELRPDLPVLIAGPTASGKSALALEIAERQGGVIVNADALQVWTPWRILTARPTEGEEALAPHRLYGHVAPGADYSVGHWLREVAPLLAGPERAIIVGGTGLYLTALTEGLAEIPPTPPDVRAEADGRMAAEGPALMLAEIDAETSARIDRLNPARIQRAWEVQRATGRGLAAWQDGTAAPLLPLDRAQPVVLMPDRDWLARRIDMRFDRMLQDGALDEVRRVLPTWEPAALWAKAIGAPELVAHLQGDMTIDAAREAAQAASRQYAKRQRTWFRSRMKAWRCVTLP